MKRSFVTRLMLGLFILAVGIAILGSVAGFWQFAPLAHGWWALLIVVPAVAAIVAAGFRFWNVAAVLLGVWLLAYCQGLLGRYGWICLIGGVLALIGVRIVIGTLRHRRHPADFPREEGNDSPRRAAVLAARVHRGSGTGFRAGRFRAVLGSLTVDLRGMTPAEHAAVHITAVLGGVTLLVPKDVSVRVAVTPVFGTVVNLLPVMEEDAGRPALKIQGSVLFGVVQLV